ncbi:RadC family protein [Odoribacter lunatus]|uniref:RadC family protein n=1 Tax=Odoribacter lunatus TaxID=2941335 RepID=UPI00204222A9|nr:DNA repair protein RadC [Odoribacter lunatus]
MCGQNLPMKSWAEDDKPREKLLRNGVTALSTYELLAIILRSGNVGESVSDLAHRILSDCGNELNNLARLSVQELVQKYKGIGVAKATSIVVAMEIGRRRAREKIVLTPLITSSADVYAYMAPLLRDLDHEEFWVLFLNRSNRILGCERLSSGGMASTVIDVRVLFRKALEMKALALVVVHNHPSASLQPSRNDRAVTEKIKNVGNMLEIALHDHVIIAGDKYYSFVDEGILNTSLYTR